MAKTRQQKEQEVTRLIEELKNAKGAVVVSYNAISVAELTALRSELRQAGVGLTMIKKRLLNIVMKEAGIENAVIDDHDQNVSLAYSNDDEIAPAKILATFAKAHENVTLRGGVLEHAFIDEAGVKALASLPSKEELLAKLVGTLAGPMRGFVSVLSGNTRSLVYVLNAIKEAKA